MKFVLIMILSVLVILGVFFITLSRSGPKRADYEYLSSPRIVEKESVRSLVVPFEGEASVVLGESFSKLFSKYLTLKNTPKGANKPSPNVRYSINDKQWKGFVSIPVGDIVVEQEEGIFVNTLEYGLVAEIIHFGPYNAQNENIKKLTNFIKSEDYIIIGDHEEEYIKGPGFNSSPDDYITILRYQVAKR